MAVFAFRQGRAVRGVSPQAAGEELERIRREKGTLVPADVVEEAAAAGSPLHPAFEWDDSAAAHEYRLAQARRLITSVRVVDSPVRAPVAYVSVRTAAKGREYLPVAEALSDEQVRARVLDEARAFIESLERRYSAFVQASDVLAGLRKAVG